MNNALEMRRLPNFVQGLLALFLLLGSAVSAFAQDGGYHLDSMDRLRVRVAEWQSAEGAVRQWPMISGDYLVGPSGDISMPFVGVLTVRGKTTAEVAVAIGDRLQQKLGLPDKPDASVEVAEFRPIFIAGDVETPGKYPYDPGLTVLKAMSLAGGLRHSTGEGAPRDFISAQGNYGMLVIQHNGLLARRARLIAEAGGKTEIDFPEELKKTDNGRKLIADETALMAARQKRLRIQLSNLDDLKKLLQAEIESLQQKIVTQNRQLELAKKELAGINDLADKGLVVNQRILSIERTNAELQGKILDMETASLRAKQDIAKANQDENSLQNDRATEIAQDRQQTESDLRVLEEKMAMYSGLMSEALSRAPAAASVASAGTKPVVHFVIVRTAGGKASEIAAQESTAVLPGDVVKVDVEAPGATN
ncbi:polysaccharide biosynthesis/export family protein [Manganibacter manganicus]|nr:polysaccharide biosynthesis/export family protein [Pseudaminobacter manganicus]